MSNPNQEAVEAAIQAGRETAVHGVFDESSEETAGELQDRVIRAAVKAARPIIEKEVRERLRDELLGDPLVRSLAQKWFGGDLKSLGTAEMPSESPRAA